MKNKLFTGVVLVLLAVIAFLYWDGCNKKQSLMDFSDQVAKFDLKEQSYNTTIDKLGREKAEQEQIILTQDQAIQQGLIENTKLKKIKSQVRVITKTKLDTFFIPFDEDTTLYDIDPLNPEFGIEVIQVPKPFSKVDQWFQVSGTIIKEGIAIDSINFHNSQIFTIGEKKEKGIINIFKPSVPTVEIINNNPYTSVQGLQNVVIKKEPKKWWETTAAKIGFGVVLGTYATIQIGNASK